MLHRKSVRFVLIYLGLVGAPILMLMAVLNYGHRLTAPPSVEGTWTLITEPNLNAPASCTPLASIAQSSTVVISQSGKHVGVSSANNPMSPASGRLDDQTLKISFPFSKRDFTMRVCPNSHAFVWTALLDRTSGPTSLTGYWSVDGCPSCSSRSVKATRQAP